MFAPSDYTFELPPELIAQAPAAERDASRLLHLHTDGSVTDHRFPAIAELLPTDAILIVNDTRVIPARVLGHKESGGNVEVLFLEPEPSTPAPEGTSAWRCLARARRALRPGQTVRVDGSDVQLTILTERAADGSLAVSAPGDGLAFLDAHGHIPLPRYIARTDDASDRERYQTMFARVPGAVAAPTAGLHFTPALLEAIRAKGVSTHAVTLHVGAGTFLPVKADDTAEHKMHSEWGEVAADTATALNAVHAAGGRIVCVGTTSLRLLESATTPEGVIQPFHGDTAIFITPGYRFRAVDVLMTNFHLPKSTLFMLVSAFAGLETMKAAYAHAVADGYRFYSYGDGSLLHRAE